MELFNLTFPNITVVQPNDGSILGLPMGCGVLTYCLQQETKSDRTR